MPPLIDGKPADAESLSALQNLCFEDKWSAKAFTELFLEREGILLGIKLEGEWVAYGMILPCVDDVELVSIATHPDHRGKGYAHTILQHLLTIAKDKHYRHVLLEVAEDNPAAYALYKSLGFDVDGRRPRYYTRKTGLSVDALLMSLEIPA